MKSDYFVFTTRVSSTGEATTNDEKWFTSYHSALRYFYFLVGCAATSIENSIISTCNDDSYFELKVRISSHSNHFFVYLRKLS